LLIKILAQDRLVPGPDGKRDPGGKWLTHHIRRGDIFVTRSRTPNEARFLSPAGEELETIAIHVGIDSFRAALTFRTFLVWSLAVDAEKVKRLLRNSAPSHGLFVCEG
jgi:hypothetical protein